MSLRDVHQLSGTGPHPATWSGMHVFQGSGGGIFPGGCVALSEKGRRCLDMESLNSPKKPARMSPASGVFLLEFQAGGARAKMVPRDGALQIDERGQARISAFFAGVRQDTRRGRRPGGWLPRGRNAQ